MQVFASSIREVADTFLHAGYISAQPPAMVMEYPMMADTSQTGYAVTLREAFQLAEPATEQAAMVAPGLTETLAAAGPHLLGIAGLALGGALVLRGARHVPAPARVPALSLLFAGVILAGACDGIYEPPDPEDASSPETYTTALLHSVVKEGIAAAHFADGEVKELVDIVDHAALPVAELTDGMEYALAAPFRDGWAQDLELSSTGVGVYEVSSPGADGERGTDDDLVVQVDTTDMGYDLRTYYLSRDGDTLWLLIRADSSANSWGETDALSGVTEGEYRHDDLFYAVPLDAAFLDDHDSSYGENLSSDDWETVIEDIEAFYDTFVTEDDPTPVVVQVFDPSAVD
jgi:hypothetical protein